MRGLDGECCLHNSLNLGLAWSKGKGQPVDEAKEQSGQVHDEGLGGKGRVFLSWEFHSPTRASRRLVGRAGPADGIGFRSQEI